MGDDTNRRRSKAGADAVAQPAPEAAKAGKPSSGAETFIAEQLKAMYDDVISQPIPDRLLALLNQLEDDASKS